MASSKTSKRAMNAGVKAGAFQAGDAKRFVPLAGGSRCYFLSPMTGKTVQGAPADQAVVDAVTAAMEAYGPRLVAEIGALAEQYPASGWGELAAAVAAPGEADDAA